MTRFVRKDRRVSPDAHCLYCGSYYGITKGESRAHRLAICSACRTPQCHPCLSDHCAVCYIGRLQPIGHCSYTGCKEEAVAVVDGQHKRRCKTHLERGKWTGYVARQLAERGKAFIEIDLGEVSRL